MITSASLLTVHHDYKPFFTYFVDEYYIISPYAVGMMYLTPWANLGSYHDGGVSHCLYKQ